MSGAAQVLRSKLAPVSVAVLVIAAGLVVVAGLGAVAKIAPVCPRGHQLGGVGRAVFLLCCAFGQGPASRAHFRSSQGLARSQGRGRAGRLPRGGRAAGHAHTRTGPARLGGGVANRPIHAVARDVVELGVQVFFLVFHGRGNGLESVNSLRALTLVAVIKIRQGFPSRCCPWPLAERIRSCAEDWPAQFYLCPATACRPAPGPCPARFILPLIYAYAYRHR